jgi:hypothetical protein
MATFGGHTRFLFNGAPLVLRAKVTIEPSDAEYDGMTNQDGSVSRTNKPKGYTFEVTFEDTDDASASQATGQDWNAIMKGAPYNITIPEDDTGVLHTYTACLLTGRPKIDRESGEVSGIAGLSAQYKRTTTT